MLKSLFVIANRFYLPKAIEDSQIGLQIQVLEAAAELFRKLQWKLIGCQPMMRIQVHYRPFNSKKIMGCESAADVQITGNQRNPMKDPAESSNDNEVNVILGQPRQRA